jgi:pyruvate,water dikinase
MRNAAGPLFERPRAVRGRAMSWLRRVLRPSAGSEALTLLKLRVTRFRQLLRSYGSLLALLEDAAEKQGGGFILDRQYVITLAEQVAEVADAVAFDLNVMTSQRNLSFYEQSERLRGELRSLVAEGGAVVPVSLGEAAAPTVSPAVLAAALARFPVLYRESGQVACRGAAAGPVCHLTDGPELGAVVPGSVLVAADLAPGDGVLAAVRRVGAILLDRGSAAGAAARLARELRVPAIVGLGDATQRLASGTEVTVDADENVVYLGRIAELLDYYHSARLSAEEEPEYGLLRSVRRIAFPLTLGADQTEPSLQDCRTVHDLVHLAHSLAGDALCELLTTRCRDAGTVVPLASVPWCEVRMTSLERLPGRGESGAAAPSERSSRTLRAFLDGLANHPDPSAERASAAPSSALNAAATEEHALAVMTSPSGFDMLDAAVGEAQEINSIYCRFAPRGENDPGAFRGALAAGVLSRLDFAVAVTGRETSGWMRGLPGAETEEHVRIVGGLFARLTRPGAAGRGRAAIEPDVDAFLKSCA